jgi:hypothetical protein
VAASRRHPRVYAAIREAAVQVSVVERDRTGRPGDLHRRQVLLVAESAGLAAVLHHLLDPADRLSRVGSLRQLAESRALEVADVVVLDVPPEDRAAAVGQVRRRYLGPLVILVAGEDGPGGPPPDAATGLLARPFSAEELRAALAGPGVPRPAPRIVAPTRAPSAQAAAAAPPPRPDLVDRVRRLLVALTQGWQGQRRVRVAGFSALALLAFTVAFAMAAQGHCGPGCDAFGTGFSPAAPTLAPASSATPPTTGAGRAATSTTARAGSPATGAFAGISGGRLATATTERRATTTTRKASSGGGGPGTTTPTTRPTTTAPTTTAPPTTVPTTTAPPTTGGA